MLTVTSRSKVLDISRDIAKKNEYLIITGLDSSGKSTLIKELFPEFLTFKFDTELSSGYLTEDEGIKWTCDYFQIFDRHPYIDYCVYEAAKNEDFSIVNKYVDLYKDRIKEFKNFIIFFNDIYFDIKPHSGEWVSEKREFIKTAYRRYIDLVEEFTNIYMIGD